MRRISLIGSMAAIIAVGACGLKQETEIGRQTAGTLHVILLSSQNALRHGRDSCIIEFRSTRDHQLVDVGDVRGRVTMPMTGMPMFGTMDVVRSAVAGRYEVNTDLTMAGTWRMTLEWNAAGEPGAVTFVETVE